MEEVKLTKKQITYIDDYLKHHQVKYWDIRIELLDHIVTKTEVLMTEGLSFDKALEEVHVGFGNRLKLLRNTGVEYSIFTNGDGYKGYIKSKSKETNKKHRKYIFKEIKTVFSSIKHLCFFLLYVALMHTLRDVFDEKYFYKIFAFTLLYPIVLVLYIHFKQYRAFKFERSINVDFASFNSGFTLLNIQIVNFVKPIDAASFFTTDQYTFILLIVNVIVMLFTYCGFIVFTKTFNKYANLHQKLQQL